MNGKTKIWFVNENQEKTDELTDYLKKYDIDIEEIPSIKKAIELSSRPNHFLFVVIHTPLLTKGKNILLKKFKDLSPKSNIILLSKSQNIPFIKSLLNQGIINAVTCPDSPLAIYSAIKNEILKKHLIHKNTTYKKKISQLRSDQWENRKKAEDLEKIYDTTLENLMTALDLRDVETYGHSRTVARYSEILAELLGTHDKEKLDNIRKGALLHDVGKIAIPDSILKKPKPLSKMEWEKIKRHPSLGYGLIKEIKLVKEVGNIILYHHERFDGKGYPQRLKNNEIPKEARIFSLSDALDAITSHRPYRKERDFKNAKKEIQANAGTQFDPEVVEAFSSIPLENWERIRFETTRFLPDFEKINPSILRR